MQYPVCVWRPPMRCMGFCRETYVLVRFCFFNVPDGDIVSDQQEITAATTPARNSNLYPLTLSQNACSVGVLWDCCTWKFSRSLLRTRMRIVPARADLGEDFSLFLMVFPLAAERHNESAGISDTSLYSDKTPPRINVTETLLIASFFSQTNGRA